MIADMFKRRIREQLCLKAQGGLLRDVPLKKSLQRRSVHQLIHGVKDIIGRGSPIANSMLMNVSSENAMSSV